jgi:hypothetical protein
MVGVPSEMALGVLYRLLVMCNSKFAASQLLFDTLSRQFWFTVDGMFVKDLQCWEGIVLLLSGGYSCCVHLETCAADTQGAWGVHLERGIQHTMLAVCTDAGTVCRHGIVEMVVMLIR